MFKRVARQVRKSEKEDPVKAAGDSEEDQDASDVSEDSSSEEEESDDDSVSSGSEDEAESSTGELENKVSSRCTYQAHAQANGKDRMATATRAPSRVLNPGQQRQDRL